MSASCAAHGGARRQVDSWTSAPRVVFGGSRCDMHTSARRHCGRERVAPREICSVVWCAMSAVVRRVLLLV